MSNEITAFKAMQTDLQISMDDVVSAFVSQYENNLYNRKKELSKDISDVESDISELHKEVRAKLSGKEYAAHKLPFNLKISVDDGSISWDSARITYKVTIEAPGSGYYSRSISLEQRKKIPAALVNQYKKLTEELEALRKDLSEVLVNLKSVTRKERQVRGRIAIRKLEDSGYSNLMQDAELIQLVQLEN